MLTYDVKIQGLDRLQQAFARSPQLTMARLTVATNKSLVKLQATAKAGAPVDQGTLRSSILLHPVVVTGNSIRGSVGTNLGYARYQEVGTGIYGPRHAPIRPRNKKMLAWKSGSTWHFAKEVKGSRPRWYMRGSVEQNTPIVNRYFATAADEIAAALAGGAR